MAATATQDTGPAAEFVPELALGPDALDAEDRRRLSAYLAAVVDQRGGVLHPNVAWNALYFGWDLQGGTGYGASGIDPARFPTLQHGDTVDAVPVGALCWVSAGGGDVLWGEVVHKEGAHSDIRDDGGVPAALSGGAGVETWRDGPAAVLRERLCFDFAVFGADDRLDARLERFARRGRYLDEAGHLVVEAVYAPPGDAEADDTAFYARWLFRAQRDVLRDGWLGACLDDRNDDEALWAALVGSLRAVDALLDAAPGLAAWGPYRYPEVGYRARLATPDLPLGAADGTGLALSLAWPPRGRVAYRALRPRLVDRLGAGEAELCFGAYPLAVCHTNRMIADTLADAAPDGILVRGGIPVHLRLDDPWQCGGVWRVERLDDTSRCPLVDVDPTVPLRLGATGEAADVHVALPQPAEPPADAALGSQDEDAGVPDPPPEPDVADSHVHWCTALRPGAHRDGTLPLPAEAGVPAGPVVLRLAHDGDITDDERVQTVGCVDGRRLQRIGWPFDFFAGIRLWCIAVPGSPVVHAATAALAEAVTVAGDDYWFVLDSAVVDPHRPAPTREPTLADLAVRALRRHGEARDDGLVHLDADGLARCLFGPDVAPAVTAALTGALTQAAAAGRVADDGDGRYAAAPARQGRARPAGSPFAGADAPSPAGDARVHAGVRRAHWVVLHLRRLSVSETATPERRAAYRRLRESAPNRHQLPAQLPNGYTFVEQHRRGR